MRKLSHDAAPGIIGPVEGAPIEQVRETAPSTTWQFSDEDFACDCC